MIDVMQFEKQVDSAVSSSGRMQTPDMRDDLRQECYLALIEKSDAVEKVQKEQGKDAARAYVYRLANNKCIDLLRKKKKEPRAEHGNGARAPDLPTNPDMPGAVSSFYMEALHERPSMDRTMTEFDRVVEFGVSDEVLYAAISRLPVDEQFVVRSLYFEGESGRAVHRNTGKTHKWTELRLDRALKNLRTELERKH